MNIPKRFVVLTLVLFTIVSILPFSVSANAGLAPNLVVIILGAPEDTNVSLVLPGQPETASTVWKSKKLWETHFRFWYDPDMSDLKGMYILIQSGEKEFQCEIPTDHKGRYEELLTIDFASESFTTGQPFWRQPLLVSLRVVITLLIEGLVFFLFGYRKSISWIVFLVINLITQGWLNVSISEPVFEQQYWGFMFVMLEIGIIIAEGILIPLLVKEKDRPISLFYAISANLISLVLGGWILGNLPV